MNRRTGLIFKLSLILLLAGVATHAATYERQDIRLNDTGEIRGIIDLCGDGSSTGILVHIPGKSFTVHTGASGEFVMYHVPSAVYNVVVEVPNQPPITISDVTVMRRTVTDLESILICPDSDGDGYDLSLDCNDSNSTVYPGAEELCDGLDNDCNGIVDEGCPTCTDEDNDGYYSQAGCGTDIDCNDNDPTINPGAMEICLDDIDNNCDGFVDEGCPVDWDGDGYDESEDCDDSDPTINPGAMEICFDDIDNNCDGIADEDCFVDNDGDGWPFPEDCNDDDSTIHPGAVEVCLDDIDNNCNGDVDEDCFVDYDGDGWPFPEDCNDGDPTVHPGAVEICDDEIDNDCDGLVDLDDGDCQ